MYTVNVKPETYFPDTMWCDATLHHPSKRDTMHTYLTRHDATYSLILYLIKCVYRYVRTLHTYSSWRVEPTYMHKYICNMYVGTYIRIRTFVCIYVCRYVHTYICTYVGMYMCTFVICHGGWRQKFDTSILNVPYYTFLVRRDTRSHDATRKSGSHIALRRIASRKYVIVI